MNRINGLAYTIKWEGHARIINSHRMVYGWHIETPPRENAFLGLSALERIFPKAVFTLHRTRIKKNDCLMPIKTKKGNWMWA